MGCKLHCGIALQDGGMSIEEAAIFLNTSFIVLCGELRGAVSLYLHVPLRTWVYLFVFVRESDLPLAGEHWLCTKWEHEFSNNSEPLLRATPRCVQRLSPPVITLKTAGRARKKPPGCLSKLLSLSNCCTHFHRITGLILPCNDCSLYALIVSLFDWFVCVHTLATQTFFCHANQAICVQGN